MSRFVVRTGPGWLLPLLLSAVSLAHAQQPSIFPLIDPVDPTSTIAIPEIPANGAYVFGKAMRTTGDGTPLAEVPMRWTLDGVGVELPGLIFEHPTEIPSSSPLNATPDGSYVFGSSAKYVAATGEQGNRAVRWNAAGQIRELPIVGAPGVDPVYSWINRLSSQGIAVGAFTSDEGTKPVRWGTDGSAVELPVMPGFGDPEDGAEAFAVSEDGLTIAGECTVITPEGDHLGYRALLWDAENDFIELQPLDVSPAGYTSDSVSGVAPDGSLVWGHSSMYDEDDHTAGRFCVIWDRDGNVTPLDNFECEYCGVTDLAEDGNSLIGWIEYLVGGDKLGRRVVRWALDGSGTELPSLGTRADGYAKVMAVQYVPETDSIVGTASMYDGGQVYRGERIVRWNAQNEIEVLGVGCDEFEEMEAYYASNDGRVIYGRVRPLAGTWEAYVWVDSERKRLWDRLEDELGADLTGWDSLDRVRETSSDGTVIVGDGVWNGEPRVFVARVPRNLSPTLTTPAAATIECEGELTLATLETTVDDRDAGQLLSVEWSVNGEVQSTTENVVPGTTVEFEHGFLLGTTDVEVLVRDPVGASASVSTTVTVADSTSPSIVVTRNVVVGTDKGKDFATDVKLPKPTVSDIGDGEPELSNDAPARFELGMTTVTWTAQDADGNASTATQKVRVEDREAPKLFGPKTVRRYADAGKSYATYDLPPPRATDNVTTNLVVKGKPPARFKIGRTTVAWTVRDGAGNPATQKVTVVVSERRVQGRKANEALRKALRDGEKSRKRNRLSAERSAGHTHAAKAAKIGLLAGEVRWSDDKSARKALAENAALRREQRDHGAAAAEAFFRAYLESGDEADLEAGKHALEAAERAQADLLEP